MARRDEPGGSQRPPPPHPRRRAWVEVDAGAIRRNLERIRRLAGRGVRAIPIVKCDGYGLGVENVVAALAPARPFGYGVATVDEGLELRRLGVREPVMVICPLPPRDLPRAVAAALVPTVSDRAGLTALTRLAAATPAPALPLPFQVEIDTGMGRAGFPLPDTAGAPFGFPLVDPATGWWSDILHAAASGLRLFGVFTHLHSADAPDPVSARRQIERFDDFVRDAEGIGPGTLLHCANSAGTLRFTSRTANAVRPGVFLYGGATGPGAVRPETAVAVRARVVLVRDVPAGTTLGYGATYRSRERERWAVVGIGYGDGLPRALGNRGWGIAAGRRAPVVGRNSMDTTVVRVSGKTAPGDVVTFLGLDDGTELTLEEVAELAGTIGHQVLTGLSPRLPRIRV
ncbi:MAG: alanine racemase [Gemmatimonadota bacterium]|nr:alanine racemase [Gemmatimonadota bacterium]MDE2872505.1 alanine racemase [Gemmatimonadota bacterium]